jgi:hypothetical protein
MTAANELAVRRALESAGVEFTDENGGGPSWTIGLRPSIPFRQRSTMPWQPIAGCWRKAPIRAASR